MTASTNAISLENYFNSIKKRVAFLVNNTYKNLEKKRQLPETHYDSKIIGEKLEQCGFHCTYVENTEDLERSFKKFIDSDVLNYTFQCVEFVFYYSGHGGIDSNNRLEFENDSLKLAKKTCSLQTILDMLKAKEKDIDDKCFIKHNLNISFRNLFILDCCRTENNEPEFFKFFKKLTSLQQPSFPLEIKNTAFLYATPLGCPTYIFDLIPLSVFSHSLYQRLFSDLENKNSRNLCSIAKAIQCDLVDEYQIRNVKSKDGSENNFSKLVESVPTSVPKNTQVQMNDPKFNVFLKSNMNILFGDITMGNFTFFDPPKLETSPTTTTTQDNNITTTNQN